MRQLSHILIATLSLIVSPLALANEVEVVKASALKVATTWQIAVTLRHKDSGWEHYANKWEVLNLQGEVLATRVLLHPHVNE